MATTDVLSQGIDPGLTNAHGPHRQGGDRARDTPLCPASWGAHQILYAAISAVARRGHPPDFCNLARPALGHRIFPRRAQHLTVLERTPTATPGRRYVKTRRRASRGAGYLSLLRCALVAEQQQQQKQQQHQQHAASVSQSTPASNAAVSPTSVSNNREQRGQPGQRAGAARTTATQLPIRGGPPSPCTASGPPARRPAGGAKLFNGLRLPAAAAAPPATIVFATPRHRRAARRSVDSGLGPHRQSMVSHLLIGRSAGSLPDDNSSAASVSSGELQYQQQQQHGWLAGGLAQSDQQPAACTGSQCRRTGHQPAAQEAPCGPIWARLGQAMQAGQAPGGLPDPMRTPACLTADGRPDGTLLPPGPADTASACLRRVAASSCRTVGPDGLRRTGGDRHQQAWRHQKKLMTSHSTGSRTAKATGRNLTRISQTNSRDACARQSAKSTVSCGTCTSSVLHFACLQRDTVPCSVTERSVCQHMA
uniref:Protein kinase domain-containing protein n=1 Tax=Macrostomum lignano TaxID=282301 RepID=A0A1I8F9J7_9PLAT